MVLRRKLPLEKPLERGSYKGSHRENYLTFFPKEKTFLMLQNKEQFFKVPEETRLYHDPRRKKTF